MDMEIDRLVGFVIQNIQKFKIFKKLKIKKNTQNKKIQIKKNKTQN